MRFYPKICCKVVTRINNIMCKLIAYFFQIIVVGNESFQYFILKMIESKRSVFDTKAK